MENIDMTEFNKVVNTQLSLQCAPLSARSLDGKRKHREKISGEQRMKYKTIKGRNGKCANPYCKTGMPAGKVVTDTRKKTETHLCSKCAEEEVYR